MKPTTLTALFLLTLPIMAQPIAPSPDTTFAANLYQRVGAASDANVFFSPTSIAAALSMTSLGARNQTEEQMLAVLGYKPADRARMHEAWSAQLARMNAKDPKRAYQLAVANRLWGQSGCPFLPEFLAEAKKWYGAPLEELNFAADLEGSRVKINQWVENQTADKIKDLIKPGVLPNDTRLVLTNAIYFKGSWADPFEKKATRDEPFTTNAGKKIDVPMMHRQASYRYAEDDSLQVLEFPYTQNELSMIIILPRKVDGLPAVEKTIDAKWIAGLSRQRAKREVNLSLPKFTMSAQFELARVLADMGMPLAFDAQRADFSGMTSKEGLMISRVIHQAFVDVNEEGTEAAAATGVVMMPMSAAIPQPPVVFKADHPFVFLIRQTSSGNILFMGKVTNPKG